MNARDYTLGLGIMSGTSLDGLDLALCKFRSDTEVELLAFESLPYPDIWRKKLAEAESMSGYHLLLLANEYTHFTAERVRNFLDHVGIQPTFIGAHGHTIFHQPERQFTYQMLNGALLAACARCIVVCDFRSMDVGLGGQGAPLVPIGDAMLYGHYRACINIGGFSNISYDKNGRRIAYDLGPANIILNKIAQREGADFDLDGKLSASGQMVPDLFEAINSLDYFMSPPPKSLGKEWLDEMFHPIIDSYAQCSSADIGRTLTEHIALQIANGLRNVGEEGTALITGGGGHNKFLVERIRSLTPIPIEIPSKETVDAKEAIVFALLGKLRLEGKINTLASVTGARIDGIGGAVHIFP